MLCVLPDPSSEEVTPEATATEVSDLADLKTAGESCHLQGDHGCVIDNLGRAYWAMDRAERVDALGLKYVRWMSQSCDQWLQQWKSARAEQQAGIEQYEARLRECKSILVNQISEIEVQRPPRGEHHKKQRQAIRREVKWSNEHLPSLAREIGGELDQVDEIPQAPTTPITIDPIVSPTPIPPDKVTRHPPGPRPSGPNREQVLRDTRLRYVLDVIVVAGGSLAVLSGVSLMANGAAWTSCRRKYTEMDGYARTRCAQVLGLAEATDLGSVFVREKYYSLNFNVATEEASKNSARNWILGSLVVGAAAAVITLGALDLKKVLHIRKKYSLAASWSPASPNAGALSFTARF